MAALAGTIFLSGCGREEPQFVQIEEIKETPHQVQQVAEHVHTPGDGHDHSADTDAGFAFEAPVGWTSKPPSSMVLLSFQAGQPPQNMADVTVSAFPGDVGGQVANINRWRRQVGLQPVDEVTAAGLVTEREISGFPAWQVSLIGPIDASRVGEPVKMVVAAVAHDGKTWFFKLMGGESGVNDELASYEAFLTSVQF
ncbi:MAG: hypothetical protein ACO3ZW_07260 [Opitutales bacterium]|jgi:hypothetical protein